MNKKLIGLGLGLMVGLGMVGCTKDEVVVEKVEEKNPTVVQEVEEEKDNNNSNKEMNAVMMDNEYVKMSIVGMYENEWGDVGYKVQVENKTDKHIFMYIKSASVDGLMNDPMFYVELTGGKKANENMYWNKDYEENGNVKSIDDLKNIEITVVIHDDNYNTLKEETLKIN